MSKDLWLRRIRNICGLLGGILPWLSILSVSFISGRPESSLDSISATYYLSPALPAILCAASVVLITYDGYTLIDNIITTLSGFFGLCIILFPCYTSFAPARVGFFQLPVNLSHILHCASAGIFFTLLAFNSFFLFTKTDDYDKMTSRKKLRNIVYRVCGAGMFIGMITQVAGVWSTMVNEIILLTFFAISWLTKGGLWLKDKE